MLFPTLWATALVYEASQSDSHPQRLLSSFCMLHARLSLRPLAKLAPSCGNLSSAGPTHIRRLQGASVPATRRAAASVVAQRSEEAAPAIQSAPQMRLVLVAAVALLNSERQVLLASRPKGKDMAGLWEFPGGKVEEGETPAAALARELHEELGIEVDAASLRPLTFASHTYSKSNSASFHLLMPVFVCTSWKGTPVGAEGQELAWAGAHDLESYPMPPADIPLLPAIRAAMQGLLP